MTFFISSNASNISFTLSGARKSYSISCDLSILLSRAEYFPAFLANAYILYMNQYPGIIINLSLLTSLLIKENGMGIFNSAGKSPFARRVKLANFELCFKLTHSPGQKPLPACNSPSAPRLL